MIEKFKNNKYFRATAILILIFIILSGIVIYSLNKERIKKRNIKTEVQVDGKVFVEDIWDVKIVNSSTLYQSFDTAGIDNFSNIKVSYFDKSSNSWIPMQENKNIAYDGKEKLNNFHAGMYRGNFEIGWGVGLEHQIGRRKYKIEYIVDGPVKKYKDIAEYNHMFVGKNFSLPIEKFNAVISFPSSLNAETALIWGHGAPSGEINFVNGNVEIKASKIPINTFVEGRVMFSNKLVPNALEIGINGKEYILSEERINTKNTKIASINNENRNSKIFKATIPIMLFVGIVIIYQIAQIIKVRKEFPEEFIRKWGKYTDFPQTKLNILAANVIYEDKGAMNFLITVLMKLSYKKYIEIIPIKEKVDGSIDLVDEILMNQIKITEKVCSELGLVGDPVEIAKVFIDAEKDIRSDKAMKLHLSLKDLENIRYKLNNKAIEEARRLNKLEPDELEVINFMKYVYSASQIEPLNYKEKIIAALKKNNSNLPAEVFTRAKDIFIGELKEDKEIIYIEQYQLIDRLVYGFTSFNSKYKALIVKEKGRETIEGIYSLAKEEQYNSLIFTPRIPIILLSIFVYILLRNLIGKLQFNEFQYLIAAGLTLITSLTFVLLEKIKVNRLKPHLTDEGKNIKEEYKGLYNFLNNDSFIAEYPEQSIVIWGGFLVLATYFGIASKVLETLKKVHPQIITELERSNPSFRESNNLWYISDNVNTSRNNIVKASTMANENARRAKMESTSGFRGSSGGGGGFTSGGGSGFGGGGGGSR